MGVEAARGAARAGGAFPLDNVDGWRGPTASQAAGLTLAAARAIVAAVQAELSPLCM